jgi:hypothetical protein
MPSRRTFIQTAIGAITALFVPKVAEAAGPERFADIIGPALADPDFTILTSTEHNLVRSQDGALICTNPGCQAWASGGVTFGVDTSCPSGGEVDCITLGFQDVWKMLEAISSYTVQTGAIVLASDHPPSVGFWAKRPESPKSVGWMITVSDLRKSVTNPDSVYAGKPTTPLQREMVSRYFMTSDLRRTLAMSFPGQKVDRSRPSLHRDTVLGPDDIYNALRR